MVTVNASVQLDRFAHNVVQIGLRVALPNSFGTSGTTNRIIKDDSLPRTCQTMIE